MKVKFEILRITENAMYIKYTGLSLALRTTVEIISHIGVTIALGYAQHTNNRSLIRELWYCSSISSDIKEEQKILDELTNLHVVP